MADLWTILSVRVGTVAACVGFLQLRKSPAKPKEEQPNEKTLESNEIRLAKAKKAIENKNLLLFLKWKYRNEPILERCGYIFPIAAYPAPPTQRGDVESVLKMPLLNESIKSGEFVVWDEGYLNLVSALKKVVYALIKMSI